MLRISSILDPYHVYDFNNYLSVGGRDAQQVACVCTGDLLSRCDHIPFRHLFEDSDCHVRQGWSEYPVKGMDHAFGSIIDAGRSRVVNEVTVHQFVEAFEISLLDDFLIKAQYDGFVLFRGGCHNCLFDGKISGDPAAHVRATRPKSKEKRSSCRRIAVIRAGALTE